VLVGRSRLFDDSQLLSQVRCDLVNHEDFLCFMMHYELKFPLKWLEDFSNYFLFMSV